MSLSSGSFFGGDHTSRALIRREAPRASGRRGRQRSGRQRWRCAGRVTPDRKDEGAPGDASRTRTRGVIWPLEMVETHEATGGYRCFLDFFARPQADVVALTNNYNDVDQIGIDLIGASLPDS